MKRLMDPITDKTVLEWFKKEYERTGRAPSVRQIKKNFDLNNHEFYRLFPEGQIQLYKLADVPFSTEGYKKIEKAALAKKAKQDIRALKEEEEFGDLKRRVKEAEVEDQKRAKKKRLYLKYAATKDGLEALFEDSQMMLDFAENTLVDINELKKLKRHCKAHKLPLAATLFEIVGPLNEYLAPRQYEDLHGHKEIEITPLLLDNYIELEIGVFLDEKEEEQTRKWFQQKCADVLQQFLRQHKIDYVVFNEDGHICCDGAVYAFNCVNCETPMQYKKEKKALHCRRCKLTFFLNDLFNW